MTETSRPPIAGRLRLSALLPAGGLRRSVSILAGGAAVAQGIVALSSIIITRLYSPANFGLYGVATSLVSVLVTFGCLRYEVAIPLPRDQRRAANLVAVAIIASAAVTAVFGVVLLVAGQPILRALGAEGLLPYAWIMLLGEFGGGVYLALNNLAIRHRHFRAIAQTRVTQSVATVATQIGLGLASASAGGLVAGDAIGRVAGSGRLGREAWRVSKDALQQISLSGMRAAASRYRSFAILSSPAALLNDIGLQAPLLLVVALYGATTGGLFALAQRLIQAPLWLITTAIAQVFLAEAAVRAREDPASLRILFSRTLRRLAAIGAPIVIVLAIAAPLLVGVVFGSRWEQAGIYVAILAPFYLLQLATSPLGGTLDVLERQDLHLIREIVRVALITGAVVASSLLALSATQAIAVLSAAGSLAYVLYGLLSWRAISHPRVPRRGS
jgi:lipopolysaccharide exporter